MAVLRLNDFSGGLNSRVRQNLIADNESPSLRNVWWRDTGSLRKRGGFVSRQTVTTLTARISIIGGSIFMIPEPNSTATDLARLNITSIDGAQFFFKSNSALSSFTAVDIAADVADGRTYSNFKRLNDRLIFSGILNQAGTPARMFSYNGTSVSVTDTTFGVNALESHRNYMFGGHQIANNDNIGTTQSRLRWSALNDATSWPASNFVDVGREDGLRIESLLSAYDHLYILKGPLNHRMDPGVNVGITNKASMYYLAGQVFDPSNPTYELREIPLPDATTVFFPRTFILWNNRIVLFSNSCLLYTSPSPRD